MPYETAIALTSRLVEVPTRVQTPPNWLAKEIGISSRDGDSRRFLARVMVNGMKIATVAVLMMKADSTAIAPQRTPRRRASPEPAIPSRRRASQSTEPVRISPPLNTNIAVTVAVAGLAKP